MECLTVRYTSLFSAFTSESAKHALVLPGWLSALFGAAITKPYIRALKLLSKLMAGIYRLPRKRATKRATTPKPPIFIPPGRPKTSRWMWLARILPTVIAPASAQKCLLKALESYAQFITLMKQYPTHGNASKTWRLGALASWRFT